MDVKRRWVPWNPAALGQFRTIREDVDQWRCFYCGRTPDGVEFISEHVIPRARGGSNDRVNRVPACLACNCAKRDMIPSEWLSTPPSPEARRVEIQLLGAYYVVPCCTDNVVRMIATRDGLRRRLVLECGHVGIMRKTNWNFDRTTWLRCPICTVGLKATEFKEDDKPYQGLFGEYLTQGIRVQSRWS